MSDGPGIYNDPDKCPAIKQMQEQLDELRREVQALKDRQRVFSEIIEDREHR